MIGLRDKEIEARLENLAQKTGRSKSFYVRQALQEFWLL
ncbi:TraY domain-containing protein [Geoalkalibacter halelectricus]